MKINKKEAGIGPFKKNIFNQNNIFFGGKESKGLEVIFEELKV